MDLDLFANGKIVEEIDVKIDCCGRESLRSCKGQVEKKAADVLDLDLFANGMIAESWCWNLEQMAEKYGRFWEG